MSLDGAGGRRSISPSSSGRASPVPRNTRRVVEGDLFRADKVLRRYGANIERALSTWEISPEEWADYIAFLARLLKAIQTHPKDIPILPHSNAIATRLAQCLNPALPSGVHQKALEVYTYIFSAFSTQYISGHLHELLPGLASVLSFASLSVRPGLYSILEEHVVKLHPTELRPAFKSLILGLLPALEEGQGEDFDRAFGVIQSLEQAFAPDHDDEVSGEESNGYFWQCLFLAVITSPARRQGALNYLLRTLPTFSGSTGPSDPSQKSIRMSKEAECIVSPEPGLLIRCFVCGLSDSQILVQRGFLDLLVTNLPLSSIVLQQRAGKDDLDRLVTVVSQISLRKDMSLNRRLWSWFLGPESKDPSETTQNASPKLERKSSNDASSTTQLKYFLQYGRSSLERCVLQMLQTSTDDVVIRARAYRICSSLMDRWEIGGHLVTRIFLPAMQSLYFYSLAAQAVKVQDVVKSASTFFDAVEAGLIWGSIIDTLHNALKKHRDTQRNLDLVRWILDTFNVKDEEMVASHIPMALLYLASVTGGTLTVDIRLLVIKLILQLVNLIPPRILQIAPGDAPDPDGILDASIQAAIVNFYHQDEQYDKKQVPFSVGQVVPLVGSSIAKVVETALLGSASDLFTESSNVLLALLAKTNGANVLRQSTLRETLRDFYLARPRDGIIPFPMINASVRLVTAFASIKPAPYLQSADLEALIPGFTSCLWTYMSPERPKYHVEAVRSFWSLEQLIAPSDVLRSSLTTLSRMPALHDERAEALKRFTVLWTHSISSNPEINIPRRTNNIPTSLPSIDRSAPLRAALQQPLLVALDALEDPKEPAFEVVKSWLHHLSSLDQVFFSLFARADSCIPLKIVVSSASERHIERQQADRVRELDYVLMHFQNVLATGSQWTWQCLSTLAVPRQSGIGERDGIIALAELCIQSLCIEHHASLSLNRKLCSVLDMILLSPVTSELQTLDLEASLLDVLLVCIEGGMHTLQGVMLKLVKNALKLRLSQPHGARDPVQTKPPSSASGKRTSTAPSARPAVATERSSSSLPAVPPPQLFTCIRAGFSSPQTRYHLDLWLEFLAEILPMFADAIFTNLLPLVETFCLELDKAHDQLAAMSKDTLSLTAIAPEPAISSLLEGLEMVLDRAYECLVDETAAESTLKEVEPRSNFFSNVATGVFKADEPPSRTVTANSRLTVILVLHDAIRVALKIWQWASAATDSSEQDLFSASTTAYNAFRVRNKSRHLLEQIFAVEPLESLEVMMLHWCNAQTEREAISSLSILQVMQVSKPKNVVPPVLDALCTRTNPSSIPASRHSSLTIDLTPANVATFLSAYLESTDDDAMDEVWPNCIAFLKDVLSNPLPHRQVLSHLLSIILMLAEKLSNTNFGEQRKMRKDLGDIFQRLLTATFTTLPSGYVAEPADGVTQNGEAGHRQASTELSMTLLPVLNRVTAKIDFILDTPEKIAAAINNISQSLIAPIMRSRSFPGNVSVDVLQLVVHISRKVPAAKPWRKELGDALNDPRLLASSPELMKQGWFPAFRQWTLHDKERMPELLARLAPPSSAGIMFGVGASAARLDADRKAQLNLRRICILFLASTEDSYVQHLRIIEEKLSELFDASPASSPSAAIKAELFLLCRVLALSVSAMHLSPLWPIINDKLQSALTSLLPHSTNRDEFNNFTLLQACKLLDLLITLSPDEFQLHEWLYITDTIDAVYQPAEWTSEALSDQVAEALGTSTMDDNMAVTSNSQSTNSRRTPLLRSDLNGVDREDVKAMAKEEFTQTVLRPFLSQLSIHAYEGVYSMDSPDILGLRDDVLLDLLDSSSIVD
ncbi:Putative protein dopey [Septoria linicola]|uniref:Dopey N-terminal domain-containing protein n=1 Tax=Septoria linicola TaxID=215465 RepID=A0A9Q9B526_9PEZI|nr:putative protein dopey [Septoria linicola]USW59108.1 Putative protein dopey [Septoria linicola]